jgi:hypothetical protein
MQMHVYLHVPLFELFAHANRTPLSLCGNGTVYVLFLFKNGMD